MAPGTATYLVKAEFFHAISPNKALEETVQLFGGIAEPSEIFSQDNNHIWTDAFGVLDELQLPQSSSPRFVITRHDDVFLLDCQW